MSLDKYYYSSPANTSPLHDPSYVIRWSQDYYVQVEENVDYRQYISLLINKLGQKGIPVPKNDKFTRLRPIIKEVYSKHYSLALKFIDEVQLDDGEFYLWLRKNDWIEVTYFSKNEKTKESIKIDFRNWVDALSIDVICNPGYRGRPDARKNSSAITPEIFQQLLNLTIQFLNEDNSYVIRVEEYVNRFNKIAHGDAPEGEFIISAEKHFNESCCSWRPIKTVSKKG
jgi:hypothetical protein